MPKRVGYLYAAMLDLEHIKAIIIKAARHKHGRAEVREVLAHLDDYAMETLTMLALDEYVPAKPKERKIYDESSQKWRTIEVVPFWPDGVVQWRLVEAMRPVLMRGMDHWSCASIPGRGGARVRRRIERVMRTDPDGTRYGEELDIKQYYGSVSRRRLMRALGRKIKDRRFLRVIAAILRTCRQGLGIGFYICQWLANYFLEPLDRLIQGLRGVKYHTRYMDNLTLLGPAKKALHAARRMIETFLASSLGLSLKRNWQVYRTRMKRPATRRWQALDECRRRMHRPRMVSAVGFRYSRTLTLLRKRNFLRFTRQCRRAIKRLASGLAVSFHMAAALLSRAGQLQHCNAFDARRKYLDPIGVGRLKNVVRIENRRRLAAA